VSIVVNISRTRDLRRSSVPDRRQPALLPAAQASTNLHSNGIDTPNMPDSPASSRRPSEVKPERQFSIGDDEEEVAVVGSATRGGLNLPMPERPALHTINSSTGLLSGDASSPNTPFTPFNEDPFNRNSAILDNGSLASQPSSPVTGATHLDEPSAPPKIHLNSSSLPNSPEHAKDATFDAPPSFSAPFASSHDVPSSALLTNRRRGSSIAPSQQAPSNYGATDDEDAGKKSNPMSTNPSSARLTTISGGFTSANASKSATNIINRRSQRAKANRLSKKDRDSKDYKTGNAVKRAPFQSTRLKGEIYKPWLEKRDPAMRWARWITIASIIIGVALAAFRECSEDLFVGPSSSQCATTVMPPCRTWARSASGSTTTLTRSTPTPGSVRFVWTATVTAPSSGRPTTTRTRLSKMESCIWSLRSRPT